MELCADDRSVRVTPFSEEIVNDAMIATLYGVTYDFRENGRAMRFDEPLGVVTIFDDAYGKKSIWSSVKKRLNERIIWLQKQGMNVTS